MVHACVDHELHTQFCCKGVTSCVVSSEPWTHEKMHELRVHVAIHVSLYTRTCVLALHAHNIITMHRATL